MDIDLKAYCDRWQAVAVIEQWELQTASLELRWRQLNAVIGLALGLGIFYPMIVNLKFTSDGHI